MFLVRFYFMVFEYGYEVFMWFWVWFYGLTVVWVTLYEF